jgi:coniferyl-aldehyde dehydrogenase
MLAAQAEVIGTRSPELEHLDSLFDAQRAAFGRNPMPPAEERRQNLKLLRSALIAHKESIAEAVSNDFGHRAAFETMFAEILVAAEGIHYARRHVRRWMRPSRRKVGLLMKTTRARVHFQPKGVVGIIVPWNYPVQLAIAPLTYALAAGNRALIKMSEFTPRTAEVLTKMLGEIFPQDLVAVIEGEADIGAAFSSKPFDHIFFTGSTAVGKLVMQAAARNLTPVTLELGGKSPTIIGAGIPMARAAERICFGKALNAGQTCVAPDYVLLPESRRDEFVSAMTEAFARMYPNVADNPDYTSIVNDRQYERLTACLQDARSKGARVVPLGPAGEDLPPAGRKIPLTLVLDVNDDMQVMQEEIFGPILPVLTYRSMGEALDFVNARPRPLALNYFDDDSEGRRKVLAATHSGGVCLNDAVMHVACDDIPFGGIGASGMGAYHGHEGFLTFSHAKAVLSRPAFNSARAIYPPYGNAIQRLMMKFFLR